ncbi:MAG TPA: GIY-YIG nuclease family protein [Elusimicrobiales bacterium]|nr:GIY-YIG nuclease family protein [Elusimicrobiales bacterium]
MWYVYILECKHKTLYTGITNDLKRRFKQHVDGCGGRYTRAFGAKKILWKEKHKNRSSASKREAQIKSLERKKKLSLIKSK